MSSDVVRVFCIDVGQGDATVIVGPVPSSAIIIDAHRPEPVLEVLRQQRISRMPVALLTHDDQDHIAGFCPGSEPLLGVRNQIKECNPFDIQIEMTGI